jgi:hypothetical protein
MYSEEFYITLYSRGEIQMTFHRNIAPPFSGSKNKAKQETIMKQQQIIVHNNVFPP